MTLLVGSGQKAEAGEPAFEQPPHAPELGPMRRLLGSFHVTGVFWYRFHRWGVSVLPNWGVAFFIVLFTTFFFIVLRRIRKAIASNLEAVLGPCGWLERQKRIYRTMWNFAWCLSERYEQLSTDRRVTVEEEGDELWYDALKSPAGFILVTAHIGHWEVGSMQVPNRHVHVVREEEMDPEAQKFVKDLFAQQQANFTMHFARKDPSLGPRLLRALRLGDIVAVQGDRPRTAGRSVGVEMFGKPLDLPLGPAALARAADVFLLPVFLFRIKRQRSRLVFRPPIRVPKDDQEGLAMAMRRIAAETEWAIRQDPYQWFCFRELWPKQG